MTKYVNPLKINVEKFVKKAVTRLLHNTQNRIGNSTSGCVAFIDEHSLGKKGLLYCWLSSYKIMAIKTSRFNQSILLDKSFFGHCLSLVFSDGMLMSKRKKLLKKRKL